MSQYLKREEIARICNCAPQSYTTMCRRLTAAGVPHIPRIKACPLVLRSVRDRLLTGEKTRRAA